MPRQPNRHSVVAQIRAATGLPAEDFAAAIGHGAAMLRKVEAGSKKLPQRMAVDIAKFTGVPLESLLGGRRKRPGSAQLVVRQPGARGFDDFAPRRAFDVLAIILAAYCQAIERGINGDILLGALRQEIETFERRWGLDSSLVDSDVNEISELLAGSEGHLGPVAQCLSSILPSRVLRAAAAANIRSTARFMKTAARNHDEELAIDRFTASRNVAAAMRLSQVSERSRQRRRQSRKRFQ